MDLRGFKRADRKLIYQGFFTLTTRHSWGLTKTVTKNARKRILYVKDAGKGDTGADIRYIQKILGHEHLVTTQIYTHVSIGKMKEVHEKTHPRGKLNRFLEEL